MEVLIRLVNGGLKVQTNLQNPLEILGLLELAKADILRQVTAPKPVIAVPGADAVSQLVGRG